MKWSFILFLPALVAAFWACFTLLAKRHLTRAQVLLSLSQLLLAFAIVDLSVFFRGFAGRLFIYDFLFETSAILCGPLFYIGLCALVEPRGVTLPQRRAFLPALLFITGLVVAAFSIGPRRYDLLCLQLRDGTASWHPADDLPWNFIYLWDHILFPALLVLMDFILLLLATAKVRRFQQRFNSFYASGMNLPPFDSRHLLLLAWLFAPLAVATVLLIDLRPHLYKYWLIALSLLTALLLALIGHFIFRLDVDARDLAQHIRQKTVKPNNQ